MLYHVTVSFGKDKEYRFEFLPSDLAEGSAEEARRWFDKEFSDLKCEPSSRMGKVLIIDGGFCRAYHKETGIAGYTLIYNSYGLSLTAHEPFESTEKAIQEEKDIVSRQVAVRYNMKRQLVGDTDQGRQIRQRIRELKELIEAYRTAQLKELL